MTFDVSIYRKYVKDPSIDTRMCLSDALDEIERQAKRIAELQDDIKQLSAMVADSDAVVIIRSKEDLAIIAKQRAALKKLGQAKRERGKALVEERAQRLHREHRSLRCDHYDSPECVEVWQNFCDFAGCPHQKDFAKLAREQLRAEGKL